MNKKIAVPVNDAGILDGHFGHCKYFTLIELDNGKTISEETITPPPHEPGLLPRLLATRGATHILAGGMGNRAIQLFNQYGISVFTGAPAMNARELVAAFNDNSVDFSANYCDH